MALRMNATSYPPPPPTLPPGRPRPPLRVQVRLWLRDARELRENPCWILESHARFRSFRIWILPLLCLLASAGIVLVAFWMAPKMAGDSEFAMVARLMTGSWSSMLPGMPRAGASWQSIIIIGLWSVLSTVVQIIAPALGAGGITKERERATLGTLLSLPVSERTIALGKLASACYPCFLSGLCLIPLFSLTAAVGDLGVALAVSAVLSMAVCLFSRVAIALACSAHCMGTGAAMAVTYLIVLFVLPTLQSIVLLPLMAVWLVPPMMSTTSVSSPFALLGAMRSTVLAVTIATGVLDILVGALALWILQRRLGRLRETGAG